MKRAIRRVVQLLQRYATVHGWQPGEYRIFIRANEEWGYIVIILVAKAFPGKDEFEQWESVIDFLEKELKDDRPLFEALSLNLRTFDQVAEGGLYAIGDSYEEAEELFPGLSATGD
ncbi:MAG: hypothetical protein HYS12_05700 [Planctomycetes bacterium]|nr:hypothetical protein [Planctomycetota bacterium]